MDSIIRSGPPGHDRCSTVDRSPAVADDTAVRYNVAQGSFVSDHGGTTQRGAFLSTQVGDIDIASQQEVQGINPDRSYAGDTEYTQIGVLDYQKPIQSVSSEYAQANHENVASMDYGCHNGNMQDQLEMVEQNGEGTEGAMQRVPNEEFSMLSFMFKVLILNYDPERMTAMEQSGQKRFPSQFFYVKMRRKASGNTRRHGVDLNVPLINDDWCVIRGASYEMQLHVPPGALAQALQQVKSHFPGSNSLVPVRMETITLSLYEVFDELDGSEKMKVLPARPVARGDAAIIAERTEGERPKKKRRQTSNRTDHRAVLDLTDEHTTSLDGLTVGVRFFAGAGQGPRHFALEVAFALTFEDRNGPPDTVEPYEPCYRLVEFFTVVGTIRIASRADVIDLWKSQCTPAGRAELSSRSDGQYSPSGAAFTGNVPSPPPEECCAPSPSQSASSPYSPVPQPHRTLHPSSPHDARTTPIPHSSLPMPHPVAPPPGMYQPAPAAFAPPASQVSSSRASLDGTMRVADLFERVCREMGRPVDAIQPLIVALHEQHWITQVGELPSIASGLETFLRDTVRFPAGFVRRLVHDIESASLPH